MTDEPAPREAWGEEVQARHRWGQHGEKANAEHSRLKPLWDMIQPVDESTRQIANQIIALEICNWNLEESILALCAAIGSKEPAAMAIGHLASVTDDRWKEVLGLLPLPQEMAHSPRTKRIFVPSGCS